MEYIVGIFVGAIVGVMAMAVCASSKEPEYDIDICAECRAKMCKDCQDVKVLESELSRERNSKRQVQAKYSRQLYTGWSQSNRVSRMG